MQAAQMSTLSWERRNSRHIGHGVLRDSEGGLCLSAGRHQGDFSRSPGCRLVTKFLVLVLSRSLESQHMKRSGSDLQVFNHLNQSTFLNPPAIIVEVIIPPRQPALEAAPLLFRRVFRHPLEIIPPTPIVVAYLRHHDRDVFEINAQGLQKSNKMTTPFL